MENSESPKVFLTRPLAWLDEAEMESQAWLMKNFGLEITAFDNTVNVASFAIDELTETVNKEVQLKLDELKLPANQDKLKLFVPIALLVEGLDSLHAARRLLLTGYTSKMFSCIRTMVEAMRSADICKYDSSKSLEWLEHREVKKSKFHELHPIIKRLMNKYDFLSQSGTHPMLRATIVSTLGKPYALAEFIKLEDSEQKAAVIPGIAQLIELMNLCAGLFLNYLNEEYAIDWDKNPEIKQKRDRILGKEN